MQITVPRGDRRYEDTAGVEVDIATSIAFKMVAERCAALRFIFSSKRCPVSNPVKASVRRLM